jgi:hypothetical protein
VTAAAVAAAVARVTAAAAAAAAAASAASSGSGAVGIIRAATPMTKLRRTTGARPQRVSTPAAAAEASGGRLEPIIGGGSSSRRSNWRSGRRRGAPRPCVRFNLTCTEVHFDFDDAAVAVAGTSSVPVPLNLLLPAEEEELNGGGSADALLDVTDAQEGGGAEMLMTGLDDESQVLVLLHGEGGGLGSSSSTRAPSALPLHKLVRPQTGPRQMRPAADANANNATAPSDSILEWIGGAWTMIATTMTTTTTTMR